MPHLRSENVLVIFAKVTKKTSRKSKETGTNPALSLARILFTFLLLPCVNQN